MTATRATAPAEDEARDIVTRMMRETSAADSRFPALSADFVVRNIQGRAWPVTSGDFIRVSQFDDPTFDEVADTWNYVVNNDLMTAAQIRNDIAAGEDPSYILEYEQQVLVAALAVLDDINVLPTEDKEKLARLKSEYGIIRPLTREEILAFNADDSPTIAWALSRWNEVMRRREEAGSNTQ